MLFAPRLLFAAAVVLVFVTSWIFLPAPSRWLLALGLGAPELSAWLALAGLVICLLTVGTAARDGWMRIAFALAVIATLLASTPLVRLPFVIRRFDRTMRSALGDDFLRNIPADRRARMRRTPISASDFFLGINIGKARVTRGILFAAPAGVRLTLDVYQPMEAAASGTRPTVVQIYGGAWRGGAPGDDAKFATYFAARGFVVFAIDYRHAPHWQWPAQIEDVRAALDWIHSHGAEYGADIRRVALLGRSAGAQLAMVAAYEPRSGPAPPIRAVVSYYGPVDLADGYRNPPRPDPLDVRSIEEAFLGGAPDVVPDRYRTASPITYVSRRLPSSLLIYGSRDHVVMSRFGAELDTQLRAAGSTSIFLDIPWAEHAFDRVANGPGGQLSLYYTEQFLSWALFG